MKTMHLFAGAGGGLLADLILGHTPIIAVEWNKYACQTLRERAVEGWFPELEVWEGDVRDFDPAKYAGIVDVIHAGFPCQDISVAGNQSGIGDGTRSGLYREVLRIARDVRPGIIFLENVSAITSRNKGYLEAIAQDLFEIGYDARWLCLSAADVGANHKRERWWCMCKLADANRMRELQSERSEQNQRGWVGYSGQDVADSRSLNAQGIICGNNDTQEWKEPRKRQVGSFCNEQQQRKTQPKLGGVVDGMADRLDHKSWWYTEPDISRTTTIIKHRADRLKALGNGQVPLQAAAAYRILESEWGSCDF